MKDANTIIEESVSQREEVYSHLRAAADFFHEHEGTFFEREEAIEQLSDELSVEADLAGNVIAELVGDIVDPVVLSAVNGKKYVGVVEFEEFDGAYGYVDYHDVRGPDKRVVCQQCVNDAKFDTQVAHATAGDPSGTVSSGADYDELLDIVHEHYADSHEVVPEDVATGATLASGTTVGGNVSWHAGNDGSGSGLDADNIRGTDASTFASNAAPVQSVNSNTGDVVVQTGAQVQDGEPTNAQEGDLWVDTSGVIPTVKWYDGTSFVSVESRIATVSDESELPLNDPPQIFFNRKTLEYLRSKEPFAISTAAYTGTNISTQDADPAGIAWKPDGTRLFEVASLNDKIYEYDVSTPWDISTASYTGTSIPTQDFNPRGIAWKPDGTRLFELGQGSEKTYEYDVTTPWDISTATYTGTSISTQESTPQGIAWKPDGTRLFEVERTEKIYEYDVSTPWDISTASYTGTSISTQDFNPRGIAWKPDGTRLFEVGGSGDKIYEYDVSTPWDISTASYTGTSIPTQDTNSQGIAWKPEGTRLFEVGDGGKKIYQYSIEYETF